MFKKLLAAALVLSLLVLPVNSVTPAGAPEASSGQGYLPGDVPAETDAVESMTPALHALVLALLNHDAGSFDPEDSSLAWEGLYNMLSLYGQMDSRTVSENGELFFPEETVRDYAAALGLDPDRLGAPPASIRDRLNFDNVSRCYTVVCGEDGLAQIRVDGLQAAAGAYLLTGSLVYQVDGRTLAEFQAELLPQDNMFGFMAAALRVTG